MDYKNVQKIEITQHLCIETTRRCNMRCAHCMRGDAESIDLDSNALHAFMQRVKGIGTLVPTGGEPTLNPNALKQITTAIQYYDIDISSVYIVTNALIIPDEFIINLMELLLKADEPDLCGIAVSDDVYHDDIPLKNKEKLALFANYYPDDKRIDWSKVSMFNLGRAKNIDSMKKNPGTRKPDEVEIYDDTLYYGGVLTLTVDGDLLPDSEYEYAEAKQIRICNVFEPNWFEKLCKFAAGEDDTE